MTRKAILTMLASLFLLPMFACHSGPKEPSQAEKERLEKEYQKSIQQMRQMTEGNKAVLDGKKLPQKTAHTPPPKEQ